MRKIILSVSALCLICASAAAAETYRDSSGRVTGSATTHGNQTTYRDSSGRVTGTSSTNGNTKTYRDSSGRVKGSKR